MTSHVRQLEPYGCAIACMAMICGQTYQEVRSKFGPAGRGFVCHVWHEYLTRRGFAIQHVYQYDQLKQARREPWPLKPWAALHLCSVDAGHGAGSHLVVLLRDGSVLDPMSDVPRSLADYPSVAYMAAVYSGFGCPDFGVETIRQGGEQ